MSRSVAWKAGESTKGKRVRLAIPIVVRLCAIIAFAPAASAVGAAGASAAVGIVEAVETAEVADTVRPDGMGGAAQAGGPRGAGEAGDEDREGDGDGDGVLTLKGAVRRALQANPTIERARLELRLARLHLHEVEVNVQSTATPLQLAAAQQAHQTARRRVRTQKVRTALEVERLYYAVLRAEDALALRRGAGDRAARRLDAARRRHRRGQITGLQLGRVEQSVARSDLAERSAEHRLRLARIRLGAAIGVGRDGVQDVTLDRAAVRRGPVWDEVPLTPMEPMEPMELDADRALSTALKRRFEVAAAEQAVADAERTVRLAENDYTTEVDLDRARIGLARAELALKRAREQVRSEVWSAIFQLKEAEARFNLAQRGLDAAVAHLDLTERHYADGLSTLSELLDAGSRLSEAEAGAVAATYDYYVALAEYRVAIGGGFERWADLFRAARAIQDVRSERVEGET